MDYPKLLAVVQKLILKNGRAVTFYREDRTPADADKPWRGPKSEADGGTDIEYETVGVFVPPNTVREFGITSLGEGTQVNVMVSVSQEILIIPGTETDLKQFKVVIDGPRGWGIKGIQLLRPGEVCLLGFVGVRR